MKILHKISHMLNWNKGRPDSFYEGDKLYMSFLCECGKREMIFPMDGIIDRILEEECNLTPNK